MSRKWLTLWCVVLGTFVAGTLFAQDQPDPRKWSIDPRMTAIKGTGEVPAVPQGALNYVNPNTTARVIHTPNEILTINPAIRVHPSTTVWQSEVPITRHPTNGNILYASSNAVTLSPSLFISEGMYLTTNGGTTWFGNDTTMAAPIGGHSGDPAPAIGPDGRLYMSEITSSGMGVEYSTNMGANWTNIITLATGSQDKNHTFVNDVPSSPYYGRAYVTWSLFTVGTPPAVVSYTTDLGATWTAPITVLAPGGGHYQQGVNGTVGANGDAYIAWQSPMAGSPYTGLGVGFAKSTDGGATWAGQDIAYACNGIRGTLTQKAGIRVNDFPSMAVDRSGGGRNGWIYIVTAEQNLAPAGSDPDIIMHRSTNGGATWSAGIRVNQDALNNGKIQYMPWMVVDNAGGLNVVYYDDRNTTSDSATVFVSRSLDGGNTWTDFEVSDRHFRPAPIPGLAGGYQGDYIGITAANGKIYPYWCDNRTGIYQAFVTSVTTTENFGWVKGVVTNVSGGAALQNVSIDFTDPIPQVGALTDINGFYKAGAKVDTPATSRNVTLRARKFGFRDTLLAVTIPLNDTTTRNFAMTPVPNGTLVVRTVRTDSTNIRSGINVLFNGGSVASGNTDSLTGIYSTVLPLGSYDVLVDPPSPYGSRRFNSFVVSTGSNPLYVVVRKVVENSPLAMRDTLAVGQVHAKTLTLTNTTATDTIPYRLSDDNALAKLRFSRPAVQPRKVEIPSIQRPKGSPEPRGPAQTDSSGGPDAFGYRWIDSDSPGGPVFNWFNIDTAGRGTQISFANPDDGNTPVPLGIPFPFYGNNYSTTLNVCTNGWMSFTSTTTEYSTVAFRTPATPNNAIYPFWDDLNLTSGGNVKYYYDAPNTRFIVQYTNVPPYSGTGTGTYQVILYPNGQIIMQYLSMTYATPTATIGIENADGSVASQVSYNGPYVHNNLAVKFYLPDATWLSEAPSFGRINPNSSANITVTFDASNLTLGTTYNANIIMDLTHPDVTGSQLIPASLRVISGIGPVISVSPTTVTFPLTIIGNNRRDSVRVRNVGSGTPNVILSSVTTTNPRYVATATSTSIAPGDSARIRIVYTPIVPGGTDTGRVVILSNDPANPRVDVQLTGSSVGSILLATSIDSLVKPNMQGGTMDSTRFFVRNVGTAGGNIQARAIMIPRSSPNGPATGPAVVVPMKVSSSQTPINYPNDHITPSVGFAPVGGSPARPSEVDTKGSVGISRVLTANGYGNDYRSFQWTVFDPTAPGTLTGLGPITSADAIYAGDFTMDGTGFIAIKGATNQLISVNPANGSYTVIGPVTVDAGHTWTSAKFDPTSGTFYATSTNITVSSLYTIDVTTGTTTRVATITNIPAIIGMAIQPGTGQMYGYDIVGDNFYSIDKVTGTGTLIGPIGFNANLAQDMAFDRQTGVLYMAAYNGTLSIGESRTVDLSTGATTLIGQIGTGDHLIDPFSIQGSWGPSSNWLSIAPTTGSIALNDSLRFTATFDATSPAIYTLPGNYYGHVEINTVGAPAPDTLKIPARMFVVPSPGADLVVEPDSVNIGNVEIGATDSSKSMLVRNIGSSQLNVTNVTFTGSSGFSAGRTSFTLASLDTLRVKVKFTASAPGGVRNAILHFTSNDPTPDTLKLRAVSVGVAHFTVRPDTFHFNLPIGPDTTRTNFRIVSTGTDTLHYQISEASSRAAVDESAAIARSKVQHSANNLPKGAIDPAPGERDSSGGPDAFGYRWIDSDTPGGPAFNWVDISSVGTAVSFTNLDDGNSTIPFPFSFPFYGTTFSGNINVCTNGWLSFTDVQTLYSNTAIPSASAPLNGIFPFWDDLYLVTSGTVYYYNDAANNRFIVEYLNVPHFSTGGPYTFEIIFKPDGTILYQYLSMDPASSNSATVGVQDAAGAVALQVAFNSTYIHDNLAVLITSDLIPWMSTDKTFGTVAPGDSTTVSLRIHPAPPLQGGDYLGYQRVTGNTPDVHPVGVTLHTTGGQSTVTVTAPNGGEQWARNTSHQITWNKTGNVDSVRIEFSTSGKWRSMDFDYRQHSCEAGTSETSEVLCRSRGRRRSR